MLWSTIRSAMLRNRYKTVSENNSSMTFEEIVIFAEEFAKKLDKPCYAILCQNEMFAGIAILACIAAHKTVVPLSYRYGEIHLKQLVDFINPPCIISDINCNLEVIDTDTGKYYEPANQPAFIMCTSGTTGSPKGVMLSEINILSNIFSITEYFTVQNNDKILIARPLYHCAVLTGEFLFALYRGIDICFSSEAYNPISLIKKIKNENINIMCATPTLFLTMGKCIRNPEDIASLSTMVISGECMTKTTAEEILNIYKNRNIHHVYGLTEASPRVAHLSPEDFASFADMIGSPISGVELKIVDKTGNTVKAGEEGELLVRGANVMLGYYKNDSLTKEKIVSGWLHTGDSAYCDSMGIYKINGRMDDMIIRAGMNIYPSEIENILMKDPHFEDALAFGYIGKDGNVQIGIKVVTSLQNVKEVHNLCVALLPPHERPSHIELVDEIPKNGTGKKIRKKVGEEICHD